MNIVEVFITDVRTAAQASILVEMIHTTFPEYHANFDLDDCDRILRVKSDINGVDYEAVQALVKQCGFHADILPDIVISAGM